MGELRAGIRKARAGAATSRNGQSMDQNGRTLDDPLNHSNGAALPPFNDSIGADLASLHYGYDIVRAPFYSHRKRMSRAIIAAKNFARELLMQVLVRQVMYNGANARVVSHLQHEVGTLRNQLEHASADSEFGKAAMRAELETNLRASIRSELLAELRTQLRSELQAELSASIAQDLRADLRTDLHTELGAELGSLRGELLTALRAEFETQMQSALVDAAEEHQRERNFSGFEQEYFQFEQQHRGSEAEIAARQAAYLAAYAGQAEVLDIGCGRGEFLSLLREANITCRGVDANPAMVTRCRGKGLDVIQAEGIEYLAGLPNQTLGGVFCAQMIEHLEPARVIGFVQLCSRKLRPGGVLIIETPNPGCLSVFADGFYKDFTHVRPYHPASLKFLLESAGFLNIELKFSSPVEPSLRMTRLNEAAGPEVRSFNHGIELANDLLYGFQDYAVVASNGSTPDIGTSRHASLKQCG